jgi:hypothetical protein
MREAIMDLGKLICEFPSKITAEVRAGLAKIIEGVAVSDAPARDSFCADAT